MQVLRRQQCGGVTKRAVFAVHVACLSDTVLGFFLACPMQFLAAVEELLHENGDLLFGPPPKPKQAAIDMEFNVALMAVTFEYMT